MERVRGTPVKSGGSVDSFTPTTIEVMSTLVFSHLGLRIPDLLHPMTRSIGTWRHLLGWKSKDLTPIVC